MSQAAAARGVGTARRYRVAGFWLRLLAAAIDGVVVLPALFLVRAITSWLAPADVPPLTSAGLDIAVELLLAGSVPFVAMIALSVGVVLMYHALFWGLTGQTLGLVAMKLRVVDEYGDPPSLARAFVRSFGYALGAQVLVWLPVSVLSPEHRSLTPFLAALLLALGSIWSGFDRDKRGLHDWLAGTFVVRAEK